MNEEMNYWMNWCWTKTLPQYQTTCFFLPPSYWEHELQTCSCNVFLVSCVCVCFPCSSYQTNRIKDSFTFPECRMLPEVLFQSMCYLNMVLTICFRLKKSENGNDGAATTLWKRPGVESKDFHHDIILSMAATFPVVNFWVVRTRSSDATLRHIGPLLARCNGVEDVTDWNDHVTTVITIKTGKVKGIRLL